MATKLLEKLYYLAIIIIIIAGFVVIAHLWTASLPGKEDPGSLIAVEMDSTVGVLLDEIPESQRDAIAAELMAKPQEFWMQRAKEQLRLTTYRLVFRAAYYEEEKDSLPIPPEDVLEIKLNGQPRRETIDGHDYVLTDYSIESTIVTTIDSPALSEPLLKSIGGTWEEPFVFPIDPKYVFQRTRFACLDEAEFPPNSVDAEEADTFYDQDCEVEDELSNTGCHQTELPEMSCAEALDAEIGKVETGLKFTRIRWDQELADRFRVGQPATETADLVTYQPDFRTNRVNYRYVEPDSCTIVENCVGAPGWRRLYQFATSDVNVGKTELEIGPVDYFVEEGGTELSQRGIFEYSACHNHFHFTHYGTLSFGDGADEITTKQGFCLQSTARVSNNEFSPLTNPYAGCDYQGVQAGWVDQYKIGLDCQWVDVTNVDTSASPVTRKIGFHSNPGGFLCEGTLVRDAAGEVIYEPTEFTTADGQVVYRPKCDYSAGALENNRDEYDASLPLDGEGYVTKACSEGELGPLRNCGFVKHTERMNCAPGATVKLSCSMPAGSSPQVVRICDYSSALGTAIPCTYNGPFNAQSLANGIVETQAEIEFECPAARDSAEPGGSFSIYTAPVNPSDKTTGITCTIV